MEQTHKNEQNINISGSSNFKIGDISANISTTDSTNKVVDKQDVEEARNGTYTREHIANEIESYVIEGNLESALEMLSQHLPENYQDEVILLRANLSKVEQELRTSNANHQEYPTNPTSKLMKISESVLKLRRKLS